MNFSFVSYDYVCARARFTPPHSVMIASHDVLLCEVSEIDAYLRLVVSMALFAMVLQYGPWSLFILICCRYTLIPLGCITAALSAVFQSSLFVNF